MSNTKHKEAYGINESGDHWKENEIVPTHIKSILDKLLMQIAKGANELLAKTGHERDYITQIPGSVETVKSTNQKIHVDSKDVLMNDPYHSLIIHIPLSVEEMWLRLAKINEYENNK